MSLQKENPRERVLCNICGVDDTRIMANCVDNDLPLVEKFLVEAKKNPYGIDFNFQYVQCRRCGLVYINPRLKEEILNRFYEEYFSGKYSSVLPDYNEDANFQEKKAKRCLREIERYKKSGRLLDVGCASGFLLNVARKRGFEPYGVEITESASEMARNTFGHEVQTCKFTESNYPGGFFDVVIMNDLIEHLQNPMANLKEAKRILKKGGIIYIRTPNLHSEIPPLWLITSPRELLRRFTKKGLVAIERHLYYFSPQTIKVALAKAGFTVLKINTDNLDYCSCARKEPRHSRIRQNPIINHAVTLRKKLKAKLRCGAFLNIVALST